MGGLIVPTMTTAVRVRAYLNPRERALERTDLLHELVLIGCWKLIELIDSVQPEKNSISRKRKKTCCTPFSCLG